MSNDTTQKIESMPQKTPRYLVSEGWEHIFPAEKNAKETAKVVRFVADCQSGCRLIDAQILRNFGRQDWSQLNSVDAADLAEDLITNGLEDEDERKLFLDDYFVFMTDDLPEWATPRLTIELIPSRKNDFVDAQPSPKD